MGRRFLSIAAIEKWFTTVRPDQKGGMMLSKSEKRSLHRQRVLKTGTIEFGGGAIDCTVRNLSASGAALEVASPIGIPERFTLVVPADEVQKPCRVVWRNVRRIGVSFLL